MFLFYDGFLTACDSLMRTYLLIWETWFGFGEIIVTLALRTVFSDPRRQLKLFLCCIWRLSCWQRRKSVQRTERKKKKRNVRGRKARRSESDSFYQKLQQWAFELLLVWTVKHNFPSLFISREPFSRWLIYNFVTTLSVSLV